MQHAVDELAGRLLGCGHQVRVALVMREIMGDADRVDARRETRFVGDTLDAVTI